MGSVIMVVGDDIFIVISRTVDISAAGPDTFPRVYPYRKKSTSALNIFYIQPMILMVT